MEQLTQKLKDGTMSILEVPVPALATGAILVKNHCSLVSAGTEGRTLKTGHKGLIGKAKERPQQVKQVVDTLKTQGLIQTFKPELCFFFVTVGLSSFPVDSLLMQLLRVCNIPYILYFHGKGYRQYKSSAYFSVRFLVRYSLSNALGGLVLGERLKHDVDCFISDDRLYILPNSVPDIDPQKSFTRGNGHDDVVTIIFLSNLVPTKGPMEFLKMAKLVSEKEPSVRFILAGQHTYRNFSKELMEYVERQKLQNVVEFRGAVFDKEKERLFQSAHLMVFQTFKETFGLVNIKAMQWGLPVISSDTGAVPDIIKDGINGFIVDPHNISQIADRGLKFIRNPDLRQTMGRAGRRLYEENYAPDAYVRNVKETMKFFLAINCSN